MVTYVVEFRKTESSNFARWNFPTILRVLEEELKCRGLAGVTLLDLYVGDYLLLLHFRDRVSLNSMGRLSDAPAESPAGRVWVAMKAQGNGRPIEMGTIETGYRLPPRYAMEKEVRWESGEYPQL